MTKEKKLKILPYYPRFNKIFKKEKLKITKAIKGAKIYHIGSTAVPDLGGKGMIDIMIVVPDWKIARQHITSLKKIGFKHIHKREQGRIFVSKDRKIKAGDTHIHIVKKGSKVRKDLLAFRDYLRRRKNEAKKYFAFKQKVAQATRGSRGRYRELKGKYIGKIVRKIRRSRNKSRP